MAAHSWTRMGPMTVVVAALHAAAAAAAVAAAAVAPKFRAAGAWLRLPPDPEDPRPPQTASLQPEAAPPVPRHLLASSRSDDRIKALPPAAPAQKKQQQIFPGAGLPKSLPPLRCRRRFRRRSMGCWDARMDAHFRLGMQQRLLYQ